MHADHLSSIALASWGIAPLGQRMARMSDGHLVPLWLLSFEAGRFDQAAFTACAIRPPASIEASVRKRQAEYFCGRLAARMALEAAGLASVEVGTGRQREPVWPAGVAGSITHNSRYAAALVRRGEPAAACGIDIETVASGAALAALVAHALNPDELALLQQAPHADVARLVSTVFSAKESFFKAAFGEVGRFFGFDAIALTAVDVAGGTLDFIIVEALSERLRPGTAVTVHVQALDPGTILTSCGW